MKKRLTSVFGVVEGMDPEQVLLCARSAFDKAALAIRDAERSPAALYYSHEPATARALFFFDPTNDEPWRLSLDLVHYRASTLNQHIEALDGALLAADILNDISEIIDAIASLVWLAADQGSDS